MRDDDALFFSNGVILCVHDGDSLADAEHKLVIFKLGLTDVDDEPHDVAVEFRVRLAHNVRDCDALFFSNGVILCVHDSDALDDTEHELVFFKLGLADADE